MRTTTVKSQHLLLRCTVDSSRGDLSQFESTLLQEGDGDLNAVVSRSLQQKSKHLQTQNLMGLRVKVVEADREGERIKTPQESRTSSLKPSTNVKVRQSDLPRSG